jgi:hypothetical protein
VTLCTAEQGANFDPGEGVVVAQPPSSAAGEAVVVAQHPRSAPAARRDRRSRRLEFNRDQLADPSSSLQLLLVSVVVSYQPAGPPPSAASEPSVVVVSSSSDEETLPLKPAAAAPGECAHAPHHGVYFLPKPILAGRRTARMMCSKNSSSSDDDTPAFDDNEDQAEAGPPGCRPWSVCTMLFSISQMSFLPFLLLPLMLLLLAPMTR